MPQLIKRVLSAAVLLSIATVSYLWKDTQGLFYFSFLFVSLGVFEYVSMAFGKLSPNKAYQLSYFLLLIGSIFLGSHHPDKLIYVLTIATPVSCGLTLWLCHAKLDNTGLMWSTLFAMLGCVYLGGFASLGLSLLLTPGKEIWFALMLTAVIGTDVLAYFSGRFFGGPKLMPSVSPNKTWSGSIGGLVGAVIAIFTFNWLQLGEIAQYQWPKLIFIALSISLFAQTGDLFESLLKRFVQVKDSGTTIPGHGGALDRLDGILFAAPIVYLVSHLWH